MSQNDHSLVSILQGVVETYLDYISLTMNIEPELILSEELYSKIKLIQTMDVLDDGIVTQLMSNPIDELLVVDILTDEEYLTIYNMTDLINIQVMCIVEDYIATNDTSIASDDLVNFMRITSVKELQL